ncbi:hypothetical protein V6N13_107927 [Hibiscus sabdariffa]
MAFVYYKFKSSKIFHILPINGRFILVYNFKAEIVIFDRYGNDNDNDFFELLISDATIDQQFNNNGSRRVPGLLTTMALIVVAGKNSKIETNPSSASEDL